MKGITVTAPKGPLILQDRPLPKLRPGYILVRPEAVAMNPSDTYNLDLGFCVPGALMGADYAGIVEEVSTELVTRGWKKGDRVCGCTRAADKDQFENGAFADVICVKADLQLRIPDGMSSTEAATLGVAVLTTGRAFYDKFGLAYPNISSEGSVDTNKHPQRQILINGGSSAMGTMYIQFAKLSNFHVLTTCSPHNFELVKSYGADYIIDYNSSSAVADLKSHIESNIPTHGPLEFCLDTISTASTAQFCAAVLNPAGKDDGSRRLYSAICPFPQPAPGIMVLKTLGYSFLGEEHEAFGQRNAAAPEDFEASKSFAKIASKLLAQGRVKAHPVSLREGGLKGVVEYGFDEMRRGVSGKKLVFPL